jgi:hypothetical protein
MAATEDTTGDPFVEITEEETVAGLLTARVHRPSAFNAAGVILAELVAFDLDDRPLVRYQLAPSSETVAARSVIALQGAHIGSQVVVMCESGDPLRPIIMGVLRERGRDNAVPGGAPAMSVVADGERQVITAEREIVLRCGKASIRLTRAGKVIVNGSYVLTRSSGYNKIKGAAVDIN